MNNIIEKVFVVIIAGAFIPIAIGVSNESNQSSCYPIPSFLIPVKDAYGWSYYFNTTNHRWYNVTTGYQQFTMYDQRSNDGDGPIMNDFDLGDGEIYGIQNSTFTGKNVTQIDVRLARYVDGIQPTGNILIGVFDDNQGLDYPARQVFATIDVSTLTEYPVLQNYIANYSAGYVMQSGDVIGYKVDTGLGHVGTRSGIVPETDDPFPSVPDISFYDDNGHDGPFIHFGGPEHNFYGFVKESHSATVYTIIPLTDGHSSAQSPVQTVAGREQCQTQFNLLGLIIAFVIISIILFLIYNKKEKSHE